MAMITQTLGGNSAIQPSLASPRDDALPQVDCWDTEANRVTRELAGQLRLFYVFSNATQLILVFQKKMSYLVSVSSIDSSGGGAIELKFVVSRNIFEKLKTRFQVTRRLSREKNLIFQKVFIFQTISSGFLFPSPNASSLLPMPPNEEI